MRVLGIETATRRGSVALAEGGRTVRTASHCHPNAHGEEMLPLLDRIVSEVGWPRSSIDRVAVGLGPGSFTGVRIGIALAQGIGLGLGVPVVGVGSLEAMARAVPQNVGGSRWALLDARRGELYGAAFAADGREIVAPRLMSRERAAEVLALAAPYTMVGEVAAELEAGAPVFRSVETDLPHAEWIARVAVDLDATRSVTQPIYVRDADAIRPNLPPSPLG